MKNIYKGLEERLKKAYNFKFQDVSLTPEAEIKGISIENIEKSFYLSINLEDKILLNPHLEENELVDKILVQEYLSSCQEKGIEVLPL
ncbi:MAG: hypothetical protein ACOCQR_01290 [bacterium]